MIPLIVQCCNRHPDCPSSTNRSKFSVVKLIVLVSKKELNHPVEALTEIARLVNRRAAMSPNSSHLTISSISSSYKASNGDAIREDNTSALTLGLVDRFITVTLKHRNNPTSGVRCSHNYTQDCTVIEPYLSTSGPITVVSETIDTQKERKSKKTKKERERERETDRSGTCGFLPSDRGTSEHLRSQLSTLRSLSPLLPLSFFRQYIPELYSPRILYRTRRI
jgi:hypothetical protein